MTRISCRFFLILLLLLLIAGNAAAAEPVSPKVNGVSPQSAPNNGKFTLTITGQNFDANSVTRLTRCGQTQGGKSVNVPGTITSLSSNMIVATYDLTGKTPGDYSVNVETPGTSFGTLVGQLYAGFELYAASGTGPTATATTTTTKVPTTAPTVESGDNSVFFQTDPSGATIFVDGVEAGTSTFTYHTDKDGVHDVLVRKIGYEDYSDRVTIIENDRVLFSAKLTPLSSGSATTTTTTRVSTATTGKPQTNVTTIKKSTLKMPTPLGTDPPATEEAPVDPALTFLAAGIGIAMVVSRRR